MGKTAHVDRLALAASLLTVTLWASAFVGIRALALDFSPGPLTLGRLTVASLALGALVAGRPWHRPGPADLALIAASGLAWFAGYNIALNAAERSVDAGTAAMIVVSAGPILLAILAGHFLRERLGIRFWLGCLVAFGGVLVIGLAGFGAAAGVEVATWGTALCLVAALAYGVGVTLQKPTLARVSPLHVTWLACLAGTIVCLPFAPALLRELGSAAPASIGWLVYLGLFPTAAAFTSWAFALSRTPAGRLGTVTYLVPPVTIGLGGLLLGELPAPLAIVGGTLCIAGVVVARSRWSPWHHVRSTQ